MIKRSHKSVVTFLLTPAIPILSLSLMFSNCQKNELKGQSSGSEPAPKDGNSSRKNGAGALEQDKVPVDNNLESPSQGKPDSPDPVDIPRKEPKAPPREPLGGGQTVPPPNPNPQPPTPPVLPPRGPTENPTLPAGPSSPPSAGTNNSEACYPDRPPTVAHVHVAATLISNMEHGFHVLEEGSIFQIVQNNKVVIAGHATIDAVTNGRPTDGNGAYPGVILRLEATYSAVTTSGNGTLFMCQGAIGAPPHQTQCQDLPSMFPRDPARPVEIRGHQVSWTYSGGPGLGLINGVGNVPQVQVNGTNVTVSAYHPVFAAAAPGKAFKDFQSPLVLDLNQNGKFDLIDVWDERFAIRFDLEAQGHPIRTGWVDPGDGLLALDIDGNGRIDSGRELFGEHSSGSPSSKSTTRNFDDGFMALTQFDQNNDKIIDKKDSIYQRLIVWKDLNSDGLSQHGEIQLLKDTNIESINLKAISVGRTAGKIVNSNLIRLLGSYQTRDGKTWGLADVWFKTRRYTDGFIVKHIPEQSSENSF